MSVFGLANISLMGLLMPETFARKYPATPRLTQHARPHDLTGAQAPPHWLLQAG